MVGVPGRATPPGNGQHCYFQSAASLSGLGGHCLVAWTHSSVAQTPCGLAKGQCCHFLQCRTHLVMAIARESPGLDGTFALLNRVRVWCHCVLLSLPVPSLLSAGDTFCAWDTLGMSVPSPSLSQPVQHLAPGCHSLPNPWPRLAPHRVYKNTEELRTRIASGIIAPLGAPAEKAKKEPEAEKKDPDSSRDSNPLRVPPRQPAGTRAPSW